jgi:undecaprenyl-phosphate galactose phosphotransferase
VKRIVAILIFLCIDAAAIFLSLTLAYYLREAITTLEPHTIACETYLTFYPIYLIPLVLFAYEGIYTRRYDFWHESRLVLKAIFFSAILIFAYLAMTKSVEHYSRLVIGLTFVFMAFLVPLTKNITKKLLFRWGIWRKSAEIYGEDPFLSEEIYGNPYLGYVRPQNGEEPAAVFVNSQGFSPEALKSLLTRQIKEKREVLFIPLVNDYDLTHSVIYELANTRTNLIVFQNRLKSRYRILFQQTYNYLLALLLLPVILPFIGIFAVLIKRESPGPVFFVHKRIGKHGKPFPTFKFRSMYADAEERLQKLLEENPEAKREWESGFKLKNDPRITKIGAFLRKTSLDELPQIFNVLRGEMNFVGPRPVLQEEIERYYKEDAEYYFMVKPGITGLWQVSGRSDTDYEFRVATDKWYVLNWSLWLDIVILVKTVKTVLKREGAY